MAKIASERIKRTMVTDWQPSEETEQITVMEWAIPYAPLPHPPCSRR